MLERAEKALRLAPDPVKAAAKRLAAVPDVALRARYRRQSGYAGPIPPAVLRARVGSGVRIDVFMQSGLGAVRTLERALADNGLSFESRRHVYEWGCGCGRLLLHLRERMAAEAVLGGSDVDAAAIRWAQGAWPEMRLGVGDFLPPLPDLGDGEVDCLISSSVFTHLTEADQDAWLEELRRVLAPGGVALISVSGADMHRAMREGEYVTRGSGLVDRLAAMPDLDPEGFIFVPYDRSLWNRADFGGLTGTYGLAFHSDEYVREHWGKWFRLRERRPSALNGKQDLLVLEPA